VIKVIKVNIAPIGAMDLAIKYENGFFQMNPETFEIAIAL
jgi:hypothetical protein